MPTMLATPIAVALALKFNDWSIGRVLWSVKAGWRGEQTKVETICVTQNNWITYNETTNITQILLISFLPRDAYA